jgi:acetyl esterase
LGTARLFVGLVKQIPAPLLQRMIGKPLEIDGYRLNPQLQWLANLANRRQRAITDLTKYRSTVRKLFRLLSGSRRSDVVVADRSFAGPAGELSLRIYTPPGLREPSPAILYFHQGGLVLFDLEIGDSFCTIMASECQATVISLNYRLCPEHPFPAPIEDALALWNHVQQQAAEWGVDPHRVAVAGDSAGGLIAAVLCQQRQQIGGVQPVGQLLVYPWVSTGIEQTGSFVSCEHTFPLSRSIMEYFAQQVFPAGVGADSELANPLSAAQLAGLPPAVVVTVGFDPLRDQGNAYAARLAEHQVPTTHHCFGNLCHGFLAMGNVSKEAVRASEQIARDLKSLL